MPLKHAVISLPEVLHTHCSIWMTVTSPKRQSVRIEIGFGIGIGIAIEIGIAVLKTDSDTDSDFDNDLMGDPYRKNSGLTVCLISIADHIGST